MVSSSICSCIFLLDAFVKYDGKYEIFLAYYHQICYHVSENWLILCLRFPFMTVCMQTERRIAVSLTCEQLTQALLNSYEAYYDITRVDDGSPLLATCDFHSTSERYVLVKRAKLWAAETNEYVFLFHVPELTMDSLALCRDLALEQGMKKIHPHPEHMYSHITAILLCDTAQPDALELLERYKKSANFKLSLHGWMEYRIAAVDLSTGEVFANRKGKEVKQSLCKVIDFQTKRNLGEEKKSV